MPSWAVLTMGHKTHPKTEVGSLPATYPVPPWVVEHRPVWQRDGKSAPRPLGRPVLSSFGRLKRGGTPLKSWGSARDSGAFRYSGFRKCFSLHSIPRLFWSVIFREIRIKRSKAFLAKRLSESPKKVKLNQCLLYTSQVQFSLKLNKLLINLRSNFYKLANKSGISIQIIWPFELTPKKQAVPTIDDYRDSILNICCDGLERADIMIAILMVLKSMMEPFGKLDTFCRHRPSAPIFGLRTDFRSAGDTAFSRVNTLIDRSCLEISDNVEDLLVFY